MDTPRGVVFICHFDERREILIPVKVTTNQTSQVYSTKRYVPCSKAKFRSTPNPEGVKTCEVFLLRQINLAFANIT